MKRTERPYSSPLQSLKKEKVFFIVQTVGLNFFHQMPNLISGTGWPSIYRVVEAGAFKTKIDYSLGMKRIEYHCANCGVHHGHVFADGLQKKRFCSNGLCLIFKPEV